jgi:erythrin-vacuolar iron transport family protein
MMTCGGGIGHTLPYLIPSFKTATTVAVIVVAFELLAISFIRNRYMDTPFLSASFQVIVGGVLVFLVGIMIGGA